MKAHIAAISAVTVIAIVIIVAIALAMAGCGGTSSGPARVSNWPGQAEQAAREACRVGSRVPAEVRSEVPDPQGHPRFVVIFEGRLWTTLWRDIQGKWWVDPDGCWT